MFHMMSNPCCMISEDQPVIAMDLEDCFRSVGVDVAGPFASCAASLSWLEAHTPDLAVLDLALRDGECTEVIRTLSERGVPTIVLSGYRREDGGFRLGDAHWLQKPCDCEDILSAVSTVVPRLQLGEQTSSSPETTASSSQA
jgi:DNA-binding response OmpR family regulator